MKFIFSCHCRLSFSFRDAAQLVFFFFFFPQEKESDGTALGFGAYSTSENIAG